MPKSHSGHYSSVPSSNNTPSIKKESTSVNYDVKTNSARIRHERDLERAESTTSSIATPSDNRPLSMASKITIGVILTSIVGGTIAGAIHMAGNNNQNNNSGKLNTNSKSNCLPISSGRTSNNTNDTLLSDTRVARSTNPTCPESLAYVIRSAATSSYFKKEHKIDSKCAYAYRHQIENVKIITSFLERLTKNIPEYRDSMSKERFETEVVQFLTDNHCMLGKAPHIIGDRVVDIYDEILKKIEENRYQQTAMDVNEQVHVVRGKYSERGELKYVQYPSKEAAQYAPFYERVEYPNCEPYKSGDMVFSCSARHSTNPRKELAEASIRASEDKRRYDINTIPYDQVPYHRTTHIRNHGHFLFVERPCLVTKCGDTIDGKNERTITQNPGGLLGCSTNGGATCPPFKPSQELTKILDMHKNDGSMDRKERSLEDIMRKKGVKPASKKAGRRY